MGTIRACIFDLDGVVVDTAKYHYQAWKRLAQEMGFDFTPEDNEKLKGVSRMDSLNILLSIGGIKISEEEKHQLAEKKNNWYKEYIDTMTPEEVLPGVVNFFEELKLHRIKMALGSASKNAQSILEKTNLSHWFDAIIDGTKTQEAKPNPEVFLLGARELGIEPKYCAVFEDAEAGVVAALNANMYCIGVGSPQVLNKAHQVIPGLFDMNMAKLNI
ncbi:MAG: beta-phosphoglucomutase [Salinivirgaceae bacterium]